MIPLDLPPKLILPSAFPRPAIIRPVEQKLLSPNYLPATPAERRAALRELVASGKLTREQAKHALVFFCPVLPLNVAVQTYTYLRFTITSTSTNDYVAIWELRYSPDGGSTLYPTSNMTSNSAPSPLVASASQEYAAGYEAFRAFNGNNADRWTTSGSGANQHITLYLGPTGILPNWMRWRTVNLGSPNSSILAGNLKGSNTGAFGGEEVTLHSFSGLSSQSDGTDVTRSF